GEGRAFPVVGEAGLPVPGDELGKDLAAVPRVPLAQVVQALETIELFGCVVDEALLDQPIGRPVRVLGHRNPSASRPLSSMSTETRVTSSRSMRSSRDRAVRMIFSMPPRMKRA